MDKLAIPAEFFEFANNYGEFVLTVGPNGTYDIQKAVTQTPWWVSISPYLLMIFIAVGIPVIIALVVLHIIRKKEKRNNTIRIYGNYTVANGKSVNFLDYLAEYAASEISRIRAMLNSLSVARDHAETSNRETEEKYHALKDAGEIYIEKLKEYL